MASFLGGLDPQSSVILAVAIIGAVPVILYRDTTYRWFLYAYCCLFVAAFATNFEYIFLPTVLNVTEHVVGNLGAGVLFALAAYKYRTERITGDADATVTEAT